MATNLEKSVIRLAIEGHHSAHDLEIMSLLENTLGISSLFMELFLWYLECLVEDNVNPSSKGYPWFFLNGDSIITNHQ